MPEPYRNNYFYPPRTEQRIEMKSSVMKMWQRFPDAIAQWKMKGTNTQLKVTPQHKLEFWTRHRFDEFGNENPSGTPQQVKDGPTRLYVPPKALAEEILDLTPRGVYTIYNMELLHSKAKHVKHVFYFFDVLVWKNMHLLGVEYGVRHGILTDTFGDRHFDLDKPSHHEKMFVANNMKVGEWEAAWQRAQPSDYCEGLMLKRTGGSSRLTVGDRLLNNSGFACKVRKPTKNCQR